MGKHENEKDISRHIKAFFDGKYGPNWHCIVGKGFATHATYEVGHAKAKGILGRRRPPCSSCCLPLRSWSTRWGTESQRSCHRISKHFKASQVVKFLLEHISHI